MRASRLLFALAILMVLSATLSAADDQRGEAGLRGLIVTAGGEPANDMIGAGVYGEYFLRGGKWFVGGAIDQYEYDLERPWKFVGLQQDPAVAVIDGSTDATVLSGWVGRECRRNQSRLGWFWTAGVGFTSPDATDVTGPVEGGGTFDITTDPGTEIILSATGGLRQRIGKRWSFQFALRADHHIADWKLMDRMTGNTGTIDDYTGTGGHFAFGFRF